MRAAVLVFAALLAVPGVAHAGDGKDLLPLVGEDAEMVIVVDVADAHDAAVFTTLMQKAIDGGWTGTAELKQFGIDVAQDIDTLLIAGTQGAGGPGGIIIVEGRFPALDTALSTFTGKKHRGIKYWTGDGHDVAMIGKRLVVTDAGGMDGVIDRSKKKGKSLTRSAHAAGIRSAIALTDTRQDVWIAGSGVTMGGLDVKAVSLGMALGTDVVVQAKIEAASAETASTWASLAEGYMDQVRAWLGQVGLSGLAGSLTLSAEDDVVGIDATLPGAELDALVGLASFL